MSGKKAGIFFLASIVIFLVGLLWLQGKGVAFLGGKIFFLEFVDEEAEMYLGLGGREKICRQCGMLFTFYAPGQRSFCMRGMLFPLDIFWLREDKIVYLAENVQADFSGTITPKAPADKVLELNAGMAVDFDLRVGEKVWLWKIPIFFKNK